MSEAPPICPGCGEECSGAWVDFGVGHYEFWGARGFDRQIAFVSNCCEASLDNDPVFNS